MQHSLLLINSKNTFSVNVSQEYYLLLEGRFLHQKNQMNPEYFENSR